ncbi:hypothetical protein IF1G_03287 [Cordyceps javanica]|uniref:Uncharacterized protein n=1 Tax=Cordyceps javanica TaxID=43265 RepID=A0A545V760_9HYPO|nr:hypothetical protein IF1G_03287 [Cordyceps javanica]
MFGSTWTLSRMEVRRCGSRGISVAHLHTALPSRHRCGLQYPCGLLDCTH